jgi:hypothetical protein
MLDTLAQPHGRSSYELGCGNSAVQSVFDQFNTPASPILFPVGERRVGWQTRGGDYQPLPSHKAIIRMTPDGKSAHVLNVVSDTYKVVHNRELLSAIERTISNEISADYLMGLQVKDKVSHHGRTCFREYIFPGLKCSVGAKSDIGFRLIISNAYGGASLRVLAGAIEFYCTNGMVLGSYDAAYHRHTSGLRIEHISDVVSKALSTYTTAQSKWQQWTKTPVTREQTMALFHEIASSPRQLDKFSDRWIIEQEDRGPTLWSVYSTLTYFASHSEDAAFAPRNTQQDSVAATMMQRELDVRKWIELPVFREMADA